MKNVALAATEAKHHRFAVIDIDTGKVDSFFWSEFDADVRARGLNFRLIEIQFKVIVNKELSNAY